MESQGASEDSFADEAGDPSVFYEKECIRLQRLLFRQLNHNLSVLRISTNQAGQNADKGEGVVVQCMGEKRVDVRFPQSSAPTSVACDFAFEESVGQEQLFSQIEFLSAALLEDTDVVFFAIGDHRSGKFYTVIGTPTDPGLCFRYIATAFYLLGEASDALHYYLSFSSFSEDDVFDLLRNEAALPPRDVQSVHSFKDAVEMIDVGLRNQSSRWSLPRGDTALSHLLLTFRADRRQPDGSWRSASLHFAILSSLELIATHPTVACFYDLLRLNLQCLLRHQPLCPYSPLFERLQSVLAPSRRFVLLTHLRGLSAPDFLASVLSLLQAVFPPTAPPPALSRLLQDFQIFDLSLRRTAECLRGLQSLAERARSLLPSPPPSATEAGALSRQSKTSDSAFAAVSSVRETPTSSARRKSAIAGRSIRTRAQSPAIHPASVTAESTPQHSDGDLQPSRMPSQSLRDHDSAPEAATRPPAACPVAETRAQSSGEQPHTKKKSRKIRVLPVVGSSSLRLVGREGAAAVKENASAVLSSGTPPDSVPDAPAAESHKSPALRRHRKSVKSLTQKELEPMVSPMKMPLPSNGGAKPSKPSGLAKVTKTASLCSGVTVHRLLPHPTEEPIKPVFK